MVGSHSQAVTDPGCVAFKHSGVPKTVCVCTFRHDRELVITIVCWTQWRSAISKAVVDIYVDVQLGQRRSQR